MTLDPRCKELIEVGPLVVVEIKHQPALTVDPIEYRRLWGDEVAPSAKATFLVDTGSSDSIIDENIIKPLRISPTDVLPTLKVGGKILKNVPLYPVELYISARSGVSRLETAVLGVPVGSLPSLRFQAILGRSSLQKARFMYDGAAGTFDIELVKK